MDQLAELLMYAVPSAIVGGVCYLLVNRMLQNEQNRHLAEIRRENSKYATPIIIQAHERLVLFIERIQIAGVISRVHKSGMSARYLQTEIINAIKTEFEHNITQQLYVSKNAWDYVKKAKDENMKLVTAAMAKLPDGATSIDLTREVLTMASTQENDWNQKAIDVLKTEFRKIA